MNILSFPFYASLNSQDRFRRSCSGESVFGQLTGQDRFPPFQIRRDRTGALLDCIHVYTLNGTLFKTIIHPAFPYTLRQTNDSDFITYYGAGITGLLMPCNYYYLEVAGFYSEVFQVVNSTTDLVSVLWQNKKPLHGILYGDGFQQSLFLDTEILEPDYKFDEEGDLNGDDIFVRQRASLLKVRLLESGSVPEYLVDALNGIALHDEVYIGDYDKLGKITVKTTWFKGACRANVQLSFEDESPALWTNCPSELTISEVSQDGFVPDLSLCGGPPSLQAKWSNTGNFRCKVVEYFISDKISEQVTRNNCGQGLTTQAITYEISAGRFESLISKDDANKKARDFFDQSKQDFANVNGECLGGTYHAMYSANGCFSGFMQSDNNPTITRGATEDEYTQFRASNTGSDGKECPLYN